MKGFKTISFLLQKRESYALLSVAAGFFVKEQVIAKRYDKQFDCAEYTQQKTFRNHPEIHSRKENPVRKIFCLISACCLLSLSGCGSDVPALETADSRSSESGIEAADTAKPITFTDDLGRQVTVERPERVACLIASFADIWCLAGGADEIVATTNATWTYFDLPLRDDVVNLGATKEISLEQLIACEPDLVLASCNTDRNTSFQSTFEEAGITAAYFSVETFEDYLRMLKICTEITGHPESYEAYGTAVQSKIDKALARADGSRPEVLYIRATGSSCKVKNSDKTVLGEMLAALDCDNIADQNDLIEQLSLEAILLHDPDYIFVVLQSADPADAEEVLASTLLSNPAWSTLTAVQEGRYYVMDPNLYNLIPNDRWGEAYEQLADILYPAP